ncbi:NADH dehydrogenase [ubiquinone] 1 beta subcomplex subunit 2, mitochondrial isoform X1 [Gymnodraco acuticeps]|uniref:NADH dehydrogenase [ubiquinone] 1 beta subcomplex subunit 2, mitochondrial n=1 Tax=Gymnodraco acuticeps TaxID=8218 RepID=A0A6P8W0Z7_GYMAC|nr:NADH dehydrogenase [ubiquinone] 1 beta subcomplex subunit 2, mitochondrial isoform X1 [Gymnodraco acuticeps]
MIRSVSWSNGPTKHQACRLMVIVKVGSGTPTIVPRYRQFPIISKKHILESELLSGAMWFWILWHSWHDPDMVFGHFPWPEASEWTDEELGIPPDDEE